MMGKPEMGKYHLVKDYYLSVDTHQFILMKDIKKNNNKGEAIYSNEGFYTTLEALLNGLAKILLKEKGHHKDIKPIEALKEDILAVKAEIHEICKGLKI